MTKTYAEKSAVRLKGRSWKDAVTGVYRFDATVGGERCELRVLEEVPLHLLGDRQATPSQCLQILRKQQRDLVRGLELKIRAGGTPSSDGVYVLALSDMVG